MSFVASGENIAKLFSISYLHLILSRVYPLNPQKKFSHEALEVLSETRIVELRAEGEVGDSQAEAAEEQEDSEPDGLPTYGEGAEGDG